MPTSSTTNWAVGFSGYIMVIASGFIVIAMFAWLTIGIKLTVVIDGVPHVVTVKTQ